MQPRAQDLKTWGATDNQWEVDIFLSATYSHGRPTLSGNIVIFLTGRGSAPKPKLQFLRRRQTYGQGLDLLHKTEWFAVLVDPARALES
jgi:hypothetical protein